ncbi:uncharacterized protein LOC127851227 [Dreissena polymorpha]|uniref:uncharacterized protein LOC127851227 n=1 Tax=Dreissena polymorpha TaxID=45954 RepID=UPI00226499F3|nr:uncharacterized protein LOC127851227 [Dreissena polymorpha]
MTSEESVTSRKDWMTTRNRLVITGETVDIQERLELGEAYTETAQCVCGKICKKARGLKIHRSRKGCQPDPEQRQCTDLSGETQEDHSQEEHHSAEDLHESEVEQVDKPTRPEHDLGSQGSHTDDRLERIKWPAMNEKQWKEFDEDVDGIVEQVLLGTVERKLRSMCRLIYAVGKERFGVTPSERKQTTVAKNRRQIEIEKLRKDLRNLGNQYRQASELEKIGLQELRDHTRRRLQDLRKAERIRKARREKARQRSRFLSNPYGFSKEILEEKKAGQLNCSKEEVEEHLKNTHSDQARHMRMEGHERIAPVPMPIVAFTEGEPTLKEVQDIIKKARSKSAPGPNGIPYKVVWRKGDVPVEWQRAEGIFVPKEEVSKDIGQFRTISLLNVEGKIFMSVVARRLTTFMTSNGYIDTSAQKGGVPGFSGCIEHTCAISQLIREAKINKTDLTVVWLDLANAYGTVPHQVIEFALKHHHVPEHIQSIVRSYYRNINMHFTTKNFTTSWIQLQKGIVTGCTVSVVLFIAAMNLIIKAGDRESRGPKTQTDIRLPPQRGFMDDLTITTESHIQARWILSALKDVVSWARMAFKPRKSRFLILRRGKVWQKTTLRVQGEDIPSLIDNPVKCLGKWFDTTLGDSRNNTERIRQQLRNGLAKIEGTGLPGKFKAWLFQHGLLSRLLWPLMLYEIPTSTVDSLESMINKSLRRWFGLPSCMTSIGLYNRTGMLQLPLSSIVEEYKVSKARLVLTLRDSSDMSIRNAGIEVRTGRRWSASNAVEQAESRLRHQDIVGTSCQGRQGLGLNTRQPWSSATTVQRRELVQSEIRKEEEEIRKVKAVQMGSQGSWTKWQTTGRKLSWTDIWKYQFFQLQFLIRAVYDVLPTPANLQRWGLIKTAECTLCGGRATLDHILSSCKEALAQGRYRWRHDQVLREVADTLERHKKKARVHAGAKHINFVPAGTVMKGTKGGHPSILDGTNDWELRADLMKQLQFPDIVHTTLRPDIVMVSGKTKKIILVELTVPWEERCTQAHERKKAKYEDLVQECREAGWRAWNYPIEVGCRGFPAPSLGNMFQDMGIEGQARKLAIKKVSQAAERSSSWLWLRRNASSWKPSTNG